jgi:hypothetical protein
MGPNFGVHAMIRASSEEEWLKGELSFLQVKIGHLQQLIAELLLKNQQLREGLADRKA